MGASESTQVKIGSPCLSIKRQLNTKLGGNSRRSRKKSGYSSTSSKMCPQQPQQQKGSSSTDTDEDEPVVVSEAATTKSNLASMLHRPLSQTRSRPPDFTERQRELVKGSWEAVENHISQIGLSTYLELFQRNPETLSLFSFLKHLSKEDLEFYSQLKNHAVRVTGVLTMLVRQLDHPVDEADSIISEFLVDLGRRHFSYGSRPPQMELLGHLFVDSFMHIFVGDPLKDDINDAWITFFKFIVFWMRNGFEYVQNKGTNTLPPPPNGETAM